MQIIYLIFKGSCARPHKSLALIFIVLLNKGYSIFSLRIVGARGTGEGLVDLPFSPTIPPPEQAIGSYVIVNIGF